MTFTVYGELQFNGDGAKAELKQVKKAQDDLKKSSVGVSTTGRKAGAETRKLGKTALGAAGNVDILSAAEREAAVQARTMGHANRVAAGQMGNLMAQFNDIGVMLMAGQNPLQLAVQQGTQITQVIGPMGAKGAVKALGGAFMGMLNPISFVTIGSIAAGAAMIQWLTGSSEEAETLEGNIDAAGDAIQAFGEKSDLARLSMTGMFAEFGSADPILRAVLEDMAALGRLDAYAAIDKTADSIRNLILDLSFWDERSSRAAAQDFLGLNSIRRSAREAGAEFANNLELLSRSEEPAVKLKAALDLKGQLLDAAGGLENLNAKQQEFYNGLAATIRDLILLGAKVSDSSPQKQAWQEYYASRITGEDYLAGARALELAEQAKIYNVYVKSRIASDEQEAAGQNLLSQITEENTLRWLTVKYGEDSIQLTHAREAAERRAFEETLNTMEASEALKDELRAAFQNGQLLAGIDITSGISAAGQAAQKMADNLGVSVAHALSLMNLASGKQYSGRGSDPRKWEDGGSGASYQNRLGYESVDDIIARMTKSRRGGAGSSDRQAEALERLMQQQRLQIDILRAIDPVAKEMIRNRDLLTGATEAERSALQDLIRTRLDEQDALEQATGTHDLFVDTAYGGITGLIKQGDDYVDVLENIGFKIADVALEAALLGTGPLSGFLGTSGGGGILGTIATALFPAAATGGYLTGPGSGTSDDILMWGSSGEFMTNAKATAKHRPLLEAINSGMSIPGFSGGGAIGQSSGSGSSGNGQFGLAPIIQIVNNGSAAITGEAKQSVDSSGRRRITLEMADQVGNAMTTPGGGAKRALRNSYGVKPRGTRR